MGVFDAPLNVSWLIQYPRLDSKDKFGMGIRKNKDLLYRISIGLLAMALSAIAGSIDWDGLGHGSYTRHSISGHSSRGQRYFGMACALSHVEQNAKATTIIVISFILNYMFRVQKCSKLCGRSFIPISDGSITPSTRILLHAFHHIF